MRAIAYIPHLKEGELRYFPLKGKIRCGEALVVSKLDRLGRDAIDVLQAVRDLGSKGVSYCSSIRRYGFNITCWKVIINDVVSGC